MTHPASSPDSAGPAPVGPALYDADDSDAVVTQILSGLRARQHAAVTLARFAADDASLSYDLLPRRVPGANLIPGSHREDAHPPAIRRNAASIAANTNGYFHGWRRSLGRKPANDTRTAEKPPC